MSMCGTLLLHYTQTQVEIQAGFTTFKVKVNILIPERNLL